jgi:D123.
MQGSSSPGGIVVIKKWYDIYPGHEFRCFVMGQKLIGKYRNIL